MSWKLIRVGLLTLIALATLSLAGDPASGAKAKPKERPDRPSVRTGTWAGEPDAWARAHERYVERARRADADVVFLGDSITHGWGDDDRDDVGNAAWKAEFGPLRAVNFSFPGDQTQHLLQRIEDGELDGHPRLAVVLIGTNNLGEGDSPEVTASGIAAVVDAIRKVSPTTRVLLLGLLPREADPNDPLRQEVTQVNAIVQAWAVRAEVEYIEPGAAFLRPDGRIKYDLSLDWVHPTAEGYRAFAEAIRGPILRMLGAG